MKQFFLAFLLACLSSFVARPEELGILQPTGFPQRLLITKPSVHRLQVIEKELYASTTDGIYRYSESDNSWNPWLMQGQYVFDFVKNGDDIIAIVADDIPKGFRAVEISRLVRYNIPSGRMKDVMDPDMGYTDAGNRFTYLMRIAANPHNPAEIMASVYPGLWISEDFGSSWRMIREDQFGYNEHQYLGWHPAKPDVMFYTSENGFFQAMILRSSDCGRTWDANYPDDSGDNSCHQLAYDPTDPDHILYSGEGCIWESADCGISWIRAYGQDELDDDTLIGYAYNVMYDLSDPTRVYSVGCDNRIQSIHIFASTDRGHTWHRIAESKAFHDREYWIHDTVWFKNRLYIYTNKGVYSYRPQSGSGIGRLPESSESTGSAVYDLNGRKVANPEKGNIYIKGGKVAIE